MQWIDKLLPSVVQTVQVSASFCQKFWTPVASAGFLLDKRFEPLIICSYCSSLCNLLHNSCCEWECTSVSQCLSCNSWYPDRKGTIVLVFCFFFLFKPRVWLKEVFATRNTTSAHIHAVSTLSLSGLLWWVQNLQFRTQPVRKLVIYSPELAKSTSHWRIIIIINNNKNNNRMLLFLLML